jgi:hypothetical protein
MSAAAAPIPYVSRPVASPAELSALLSPFLSELMRHSNIKPYLDVINEIAFDNIAMADALLKAALECIEQVSSSSSSASARPLLLSSPPLCL